MRHAILAAVFAASGCSSAGLEGPLTTVRDSAGVRITEHSAAAQPAESWRLETERAVEFAMPEEDVPLFRVSAALRRDDDRVFVADAGNSRVVVFDAAGSMLAASGGPGDGPGEFRSMGVMRPWIADSLIVWDDRARRVSVLTPAGDFARSFGLSLPDGVPFARVLGVYPDGSFLGMSFTNFGEQPRPGLMRAPIALHHFGSDGSHLAPAGEVPGTEVFYTTAAQSGTVRLLPPHFFRSGNHLASDLLLEAPNDSWELSFCSPDGTPVRIVRWLRPPVTVTPDAVAQSLARLLNRMSDEARDGARAVADELDVHETMPAFGDVFYDRMGRVWLEDYDPDDEGPSQWTIVGPDGELLATAELPPDTQLRDAGSDWILVRRLDELDVEHVLLVPIARASRNGAA